MENQDYSFYSPLMDLLAKKNIKDKYKGDYITEISEMGNPQSRVSNRNDITLNSGAPTYQQEPLKEPNTGLPIKEDLTQFKDVLSDKNKTYSDKNLIDKNNEVLKNIEPVKQDNKNEPDILSAIFRGLASGGDVMRGKPNESEQRIYNQNINEDLYNSENDPNSQIGKWTTELLTKQGLIDKPISYYNAKKILPMLDTIKPKDDNFLEKMIQRGEATDLLARRRESRKELQTVEQAKQSVNTINNQLDKLTNELNSLSTIDIINPTSEKMGTVEALRSTLLNDIVRTLGGEKGPLTKDDIKNMSGMLPKITDISIEKRNAKLKQVKDFIKARINQWEQSKIYQDTEGNLKNSSQINNKKLNTPKIIDLGNGITAERIE